MTAVGQPEHADLQAARAPAGGSGSGRADLVRGRLAPLFAPAPPTPLTMRGVVLAVAAVVVSTALVLLRIRAANPLNVIWAEDVSNFLTDAYMTTPAEAIFKSINGYFLVYARVLAEVASLFPVTWGAGVLVGLASLSSALMGLVVYVASGSLLRHPLARSIAALGTFAVPLAYGMANQVAPLHFVMLYAVFWCLLWTPRSRAGRVVQVMMIALTGLSTILIVFMLPLALLRLWVSQTWLSVQLLLSFLPGLVLQAGGLILGVSSRDGVSVSRLDALWAIGSYATWGLPYGFLGDNAMRRAEQHPPGYYTGFGTGAVYWIGVTLVWLFVLGVVAVALCRITRPDWVFAAIAFGHAVILFALEAMIDGNLVARYVYVPSILIFVALSALLLPRSDRAPVRAMLPLTGLAIVFVLCAAVNFQSRNDGRPPWDVMVRQATAVCEGDPSVVQVTASAGGSGWRVTLPCSRLR